jgi:UDPglucose 6-dehydrogenase
LVHTARTVGHELRLVQDADAINEDQKAWLLDEVLKGLGDDPAGKTAAVWGLAFKPNTDDVREAPALTLIRGLLDAGVKVRAHDPIAAENFNASLKRPGAAIQYVSKPYEAAEGAQVLVLCTEWGPYRSPDFSRLRELMSGNRVFDGRNQWEAEIAEGAGLRFWGVGR